MTWRLVETLDSVDWMVDQSDHYTIINWSDKEQKVRVDIMTIGHDPVVSFIGPEDAVRKTVVRYMEYYFEGFSHEHASYIGREILNCANLKDKYIQG